MYFVITSFVLFVCFLLFYVPFENTLHLRSKHQTANFRPIYGTKDIWVGSISYHTCCDLGSQFMWSYWKDCPNLVTFYNKVGVLRTSSNLDIFFWVISVCILCKKGNNIEVFLYYTYAYNKTRYSFFTLHLAFFGLIFNESVKCKFKMAACFQINYPVNNKIDVCICSPLTKKCTFLT